ncbi:MAG: hypothetical protein RL375_1206 [Pseudomonadota bacterium]
MGLFTFFKRSNGKRPSQAAPLSEDGMAEIRLRARRRLLGAVVLVLAAVVGLPLILETQPRPVAKDISIDVRRDGAAGVSVDSPLSAARPLADQGDTANPAPGTAVAPNQAGVDASARSPALVAPVAAAARGTTSHVGAATADVSVSTGQSRVASVAAGSQPVLSTAARTAAPQAVASAAKPHQAAPDNKSGVPAKVAATTQQAPARAGPPAHAAPTVPARTATPVPATPVRVAAAPAAAPTPRPDDKAPARPAPEAKPAAAPAGTRFVLQVGAFEQAAAARETRGKVEKLGLKAYEQEIDAAGARRIRVRLGPYASRDEAERVLQKLRAGGLNAGVVPL